MSPSTFRGDAGLQGQVGKHCPEGPWFRGQWMLDSRTRAQCGVSARAGLGDGRSWGEWVARGPS